MGSETNTEFSDSPFLRIPWLTGRLHQGIRDLRIREAFAHLPSVDIHMENLCHGIGATFQSSPLCRFTLSAFNWRSGWFWMRA